MTRTASLSPVVRYHGLARRYLMPSGFLMRPLLNGGTLARLRMATEDTVLIHHQDGLCVYRVSKVQLRITGGSLDLEIETDRNPDCSLGALGSPTLCVESATMRSTSLATLQRETIAVPIGWDTAEVSKSDNIFRLYLSEHFALDNNVLTIERADGNAFRIFWEADAADLNYYDDRARRNRIEALATFRPKS